ncbi:hypothetical protein Taro_018760 [Colocasia esculenta]|uniref:Uncharacterized protein n=1 Tax=Colocasia esculenta TaxID=4460 RepID=A0A843UUT1_COLES|nr:hypothetical protein [Colocasia esculenta]
MMVDEIYKALLEVLQLPVDSRPKAVDRRMLSRTQITGTVIQMGMTFKSLSAEWTDMMSKPICFYFCSVV